MNTSQPSSRLVIVAVVYLSIFAQGKHALDGYYTTNDDEEIAYIQVKAGNRVVVNAAAGDELSVEGVLAFEGDLAGEHVVFNFGGSVLRGMVKHDRILFSNGRGWTRSADGRPPQKHEVEKQPEKPRQSVPGMRPTTYDRATSFLSKYPERFKPSFHGNLSGVWASEDDDELYVQHYISGLIAFFSYMPPATLVAVYGTCDGQGRVVFMFEGSDVHGQATLDSIFLSNGVRWSRTSFQVVPEILQKFHNYVPATSFLKDAPARTTTLTELLSTPFDAYDGSPFTAVNFTDMWASDSQDLYLFHLPSDDIIVFIIQPTQPATVTALHAKLGEGGYFQLVYETAALGQESGIATRNSISLQSGLEFKRVGHERSVPDHIRAMCHSLPLSTIPDAYKRQLALADASPAPAPVPSPPSTSVDAPQPPPPSSNTNTAQHVVTAADLLAVSIEAPVASSLANLTDVWMKEDQEVYILHLPSSDIVVFSVEPSPFVVHAWQGTLDGEGKLLLWLPTPEGLRELPGHVADNVLHLANGHHYRRSGDDRFVPAHILPMFLNHPLPSVPSAYQPYFSPTGQRVPMAAGQPPAKQPLPAGDAAGRPWLPHTGAAFVNLTGVYVGVGDPDAEMEQLFLSHYAPHKAMTFFVVAASHEVHTMPGAVDGDHVLFQLGAAALHGFVQGSDILFSNGMRWAKHPELVVAPIFLSMFYPRIVAYEQGVGEHNLPSTSHPVHSASSSVSEASQATPMTPTLIEHFGAVGTDDMSVSNLNLTGLWVNDEDPGVGIGYIEQWPAVGGKPSHIVSQAVTEGLTIFSRGKLFADGRLVFTFDGSSLEGFATSSNIVQFSNGQAWSRTACHSDRDTQDLCHYFVSPSNSALRASVHPKP